MQVALKKKSLFPRKIQLLAAAVNFRGGLTDADKLTEPLLEF